jgi:hypothetical protein
VHQEVVERLKHILRQPRLEAVVLVVWRVCLTPEAVAVVVQTGTLTGMAVQVVLE